MELLSSMWLIFTCMSAVPLQEYNKCKKELEECKKLLADSQSKSLELNSNLSIKNMEMDKLNDLLEKLKSKHVHELETLQEKAEVEKQRAIVELQKEWQKYYQQMHQKYNESIEEYNNKYRDLLQNMKLYQ